MKNGFRGMVLFSIVLIIQLVFTAPNVALAAEDQISITELNLKVMPEFINPEGWDNNVPSLLIGYHGTVTNHSDQPYEGEIIISVPTDLPMFTPGFVAQYKEETEENIELKYEISEEGKYFAWTPPEPIPANGDFNFILEFFSASIEGDVERSFDYQYIVENEIESLNIEFYAPIKVDDFKISKEPTSKTDSFGLEIHLFEYKDVKEGEVLDFNTTYTKDNIVTTVEVFNDMNAPNDDAHAGINEDGNNEQPGQTIENDSLFSTENIILLALTIIIVAAFLIIVLKKKAQPTNGKKKKTITPKKIVNKEEEIKKLRKMLAEGQIDESTYKEKRSNLN